MFVKPPLVSIGLPVYNGQDFVGQAVESVLNQTVEDWELIISDNASSDLTLTICQEFARKDNRIRIVLNERNLGTAPNFNRTFHESRGRYFKWLAHDDYCGPEFLEVCLQLLETDEHVALAVPKLVYVDASRRPLGRQTSDMSVHGTAATERVSRLMDLERASTDVFWSLYGVIRRRVLEETRLMEIFNASDQVLLLEIALRGTFAQAPQELLFRREHGLAASMKTDRSAADRAKWNYSDDKRTLVFPYWRLLREHLASIRNSRISPTDQTRCAASVLRRFSLHWKDLARELLDGASAVVARRSHTLASGNRPLGLS
jgi:glycosyltransferase involved in cell wall biosynthesis